MYKKKKEKVGEKQTSDKINNFFLLFSNVNVFEMLFGLRGYQVDSLGNGP
jgi:hypothetical protein